MPFIDAAAVSPMAYTVNGLDRGGNLLAVDLSVKHVSVDPLMVQSNGHRTFIAGQLAAPMLLGALCVALALLFSFSLRRNVEAGSPAVSRA